MRLTNFHCCHSLHPPPPEWALVLHVFCIRYFVCTIPNTLLALSPIIAHAVMLHHQSDQIHEIEGSLYLQFPTLATDHSTMKNPTQVCSKQQQRSHPQQPAECVPKSNPMAWRFGSCSPNLTTSKTKEQLIESYQLTLLKMTIAFHINSLPRVLQVGPRSPGFLCDDKPPRELAQGVLVEGAVGRLFQCGLDRSLVSIVVRVCLLVIRERPSLHLVRDIGVFVDGGGGSIAASNDAGRGCNNNGAMCKEVL